MCQQDDAAHCQPGAECPDNVALAGRQHGCGGRQRADMHRMARRKGVSRLAGDGDAMEMAAHGQTIRALLVEDRFEQMRNQAGRERREEEVVAIPALACGSLAAIQPPCCRGCQEHMFIGAPRQQASRLLGARAGVFRDGIGDGDVASARRDAIGNHQHEPIARGSFQSGRGTNSSST